MYSECLLNNSLSILAISGAISLLLISAFVVKLLSDLSKLAKSLDETVGVLKDEAKPILNEINSTMSGVSAIVNGFDKNIGGVTKFFGGFTTAGLLAFSKARLLSKGALKKGIIWLISLVKLIIKK